MEQYKGLLPTIAEMQPTVVEYEPKIFSLDSFNSLIGSFYNQWQPREFVLPISLFMSLCIDFDVECSFTEERMRWFNTSTNKAYDYAEYTPYNKGCLYKIRKYITHLDVYYGTGKIAYCTTVQECIDYIKKHSQ